ncbi:PAS and helix-turn-helix domain-containing protein [Pseudomonas mandelii]|uniref:PAS and helix-turn-helix domain-containing protein n=1 Tax=Pseudomonas mandelii TaxID=75612 RepID=UPI00209E4CB5|nr:PAS and helix-turn-helix domain-containing protein [Pseudomonas mandelii]MCO8310958.1 PAS and helix-turn-helix domain-containing protein [Pseudomonas mandelii]
MINFNEAFTNLFGYKREEILGQLIRHLYPSQADYQDTGERSLECLRMNPLYTDERFMRHRSGEIFWLRANGRTLTPQDPFEMILWHFERLERVFRSLANLTVREREISTYIVNGLTCKEIGRLLAISHRTVEAHRARLMRKLGAKNTAELVSKIIVLD